MFASTRRISERARTVAFGSAIVVGVVAGSGCGGAALTIELFLNPVAGVDYSSMTALVLQTRVDSDDGEEGTAYQSQPFARNDARKVTVEMQSSPPGELLLRVSGCPGDAELCAPELARFVGCAREPVATSDASVPIEVTMYPTTDTPPECSDLPL